MTNPVFFVEPANLVIGTCVVDGDEGRHAATVKRIRVGEAVDLCDGDGRRATGQVTAVTKNSIDVRVEDISTDSESTLKIIAVQALAKGDRAELAIEIATEVGADEIIPWKAEHCIAKWDDSGKTLSKWQRIAREASKQSRRSRIPEIHTAQTTAQLLEQLTPCDAVYVLHESATQSLASAQIPQRGVVAVVTGPEGGISANEIEQFRDAGFTIVRMGDTVMRTSTAGAIAIGVISAKTSRW
jgi:16S rRNA (uracil1498-N3)-methyltransferase